MKLTHKAKDDFSYKYNMSNFNEYSEVLQNALIIEFFDSVGIYVGFYYKEPHIQCYINNKNIGKFNTRQEATEKAIEKANLIYNDKV